MTHIAQTNTSQAAGLQASPVSNPNPSMSAPPPLGYRTGLLIR
jgi:hypothetical protein